MTTLVSRLVKCTNSLWPDLAVTKKEEGMNNRDIVATRLAAVRISLSEQELDHLAEAYAKLLQWETVVQEMIQLETEPALTFRAKVEGEL
jgi:hypothetical protein